MKRRGSLAGFEQLVERDDVLATDVKGNGGDQCRRPM